MTTKILVVDESPVERRFMKRTLRAEGFKVIEAVDGDAACTLLRRTSDIGMVFLDQDLSAQSGLELLEDLASVGRLPKVPVVMLAASSSRRLSDRARRVGVDIWLVRPVAAELIVALARTVAIPADQLVDAPTTPVVPAHEAATQRALAELADSDS